MMGNVIKLLALFGWLGVVLAINAALFVTNMISIDTGLELLNTEKRPVDHFPIVGPVLRAIAPHATLANWMALVIAALMFIGAYWVSHYVIKIVRLLFDIRVYRRRNDAESVSAAIDIIGRDLVVLIPVAVFMAWLILGDLFLFSYRGVAAAANIDDPVEAASRIGAWWTDTEPELAGAAMWFATTAGPTMYFAASLLAPLLVAHALMKIHEVWNRIMTSISEQWSAAAGANAQPALELYGYAADGNPVYDPNAPIAYDIDQQPVAAARQGGAADAEEPAQEQGHEGAGKAAAIQHIQQFPDNGERVTVIGGRPGETVTVAQALERPALYHVERATRRVYQRAYWGRLNGKDTARGDSAEAA
jgi:hypothetical protein